MNVETFVISPLQSNCYVVCEGTDCVIVDPGDVRLEPVFEYIRKNALSVMAIWCTHAHFDHVLGVDVARQAFSVPALVHEADLPEWDDVPSRAARWLSRDYPVIAPPDGRLKDNDILTVGKARFRVIHTPGHSPGSVCFVGDTLALTGDTLFAGTIGRTDLERSDSLAMQRSLQRLLSLDDSLALYPGHMQHSTMRDERAVNPFLKRASNQLRFSESQP